MSRGIYFRELARSSLGPGNNAVFIFIDDGVMHGEADEIAVELSRDGEYWLSITLLGGGRIDVRISDASLAERLAKALR